VAFLDDNNCGKGYCQTRRADEDLTFIREVVEEELEQYIYDKLGRTPMIIPVLIEV